MMICICGYLKDGSISDGMSKLDIVDWLSRVMVCRNVYGMSNFCLFFRNYQHTNEFFYFNRISLVCWHDRVVLVWNIYIMISWRWVCFVCWLKWWYVEIGYFWLIVMSDGMSKGLWYVEFYIILHLHLYLMLTYQWYF